QGFACPTSAPVCGLAAPVSVKVIVPLRFTPRGAPPRRFGFENRTVAVHVPPGASGAAVQVCASRLKNQVIRLPPNGTLTLVTATWDPPAPAVLVSVTVVVPVIHAAVVQPVRVGNVIVAGLGVI